MGSSNRLRFLIFSKRGGCESSAKVCVPPCLLDFLAFFLFGREEVARAFFPDPSAPLAHSSFVEGLIKRCFMFFSVGAHTNVHQSAVSFLGLSFCLRDRVRAVSGSPVALCNCFLSSSWRAATLWRAASLAPAAGAGSHAFLYVRGRAWWTGTASLPPRLPRCPNYSLTWSKPAPSAVSLMGGDSTRRLPGGATPGRSLDGRSIHASGWGLVVACGQRIGA